MSDSSKVTIACIVLAGLLLIGSVGEAATFRLGFVRPYNGSASMDLTDDVVVGTTQMHIGMLAAIQEANEEAAMLEAGNTSGINELNSIGPGNLIELLSADMSTGDEPSWSDVTFRAPTELIQNYSVDALTAFFFGGDATIVQGLAAKVPVIGPQSVDNIAKMHNPEKYPEVINWQMGASEELGELFNLAMNGEARCTRIGFIFPIYEAVEASEAAGVQDFAAQNGITVTYGIISSSLAADRNTTEALAFFSQFTEATMPQCFIFFSSPEIVLSVIIFSKFLPTIDFDNTYWFAGSPAALPNYAAFTGSSADFYNLHVVNQYPNPLDTSYVFIQRYRNSLIKFIASGNVSLVPGDDPYTSPNTFSLSGYAIARLLIAGLSRTKSNFTGPGFLAAVYGTQLFRIDDIVLGPYSNGCIGAMVGDDSCYCNIGAKKLFMNKVDPDLNVLVPVKDNILLGESGVATLDLPSGVCTSDMARDVKRNMWVGYYDESSATGIAASGATAFSTELEQSLYLLKKQRQSEEGMSHNVDIANSTSAHLKVGKRVPMALVVGGSASSSPSSSATEASSFGIPLLTWDVVTSVMPISDPSTWNRTMSPSFDPVLADYIHTVAAFAHGNFGGATPTILAATQQMADLTKQSVETFTGVTMDGTITVYGSNPPSLVSYGAGAVVLVVDQSSSALNAMLATLPSANTGATIVFAAPEHQVVTAATSSSSVAAVIAATRGVYFTSVMASWWGASSSSLVSSWRTLHGYNSSVYPSSPAVLRAYRSAVLLDEAGDKVSKGFSQPELLSTLYSIGSFSVNDAVVGSFSDDTCDSEAVAQSPYRRCQCGKGPRKFYVHVLADAADPAAASNTLTSFSSTLSGCGIEYVALPTDNTLALVLGIGLPSAMLLLGLVVLLYKLTRPPRDNSCAPKNADQPFCILFTDIQSSTSLWARIPEVMAQAVETHHEIMREQIDKFRGYEVKTIGDSFMVAFQEPKDALKFSLSVQQALHDSPWQGEAESINRTYYDLEAEWIERELAANPDAPPVQLLKGQQVPTWQRFEEQLKAARTTTIWSGLRVRIGIHYGSGSIQLDPVSLGYDYYGTVVNTAARVESVGHGGQIAVTGAVLHAILGDEATGSTTTMGDVGEGTGQTDNMSPLPSSWNAQRSSLGPVPLRGLSEPVNLTQIFSTGLAGRVFPRLRVDQALEEDDDEEQSADDGLDTGSVRHSVVSGGSARSGIGKGAPEKVAEAYAKKSTTHRTVALNAIMTNYYVFKVVLGLAKPDQYMATLEHLAGRWGLGKNAKAALKKTTGQDKVLMELVAKGTLAYEEKLKLHKKAGTSTDSASQSRNSLSMSHGRSSGAFPDSSPGGTQVTPFGRLDTASRSPPSPALTPSSRAGGATNGQSAKEQLYAATGGSIAQVPQFPLDESLAERVDNQG